MKNHVWLTNTRSKQIYKGIRCFTFHLPEMKAPMRLSHVCSAFCPDVAQVLQLPLTGLGPQHPLCSAFWVFAPKASWSSSLTCAYQVSLLVQRKPILFTCVFLIPGLMEYFSNAPTFPNCSKLQMARFQSLGE